MKFGHWVLTNNLNWDNDAFGFIYIITNLVNNKKYIGCKQIFKKTIKYPSKTRKNKKHILKESNWKTYTGSSKELNDDIKKFGKKNFKFEILHFAKSKSHLKYLEAKEQFDREVLLKDEYYNGIINLRIGKIKL